MLNISFICGSAWNDVNEKTVTTIFYNRFLHTVLVAALSTYSTSAANVMLIKLAHISPTCPALKVSIALVSGCRHRPLHSVPIPSALFLRLS